MSLVQVARKARLVNAPEGDFPTLLFSRPQSRRACRLFLSWLKKNGSEASRHEISQFGWDLEGGLIDSGFRYARKNFYTTILKRLVDLGLIGLRARWSRPRVIEKYVPISQPIPVRPPSGTNFYHIAWHICRKWNEEWL